MIASDPAASVLRPSRPRATRPPLLALLEAWRGAEVTQQHWRRSEVLSGGEAVEDGRGSGGGGGEECSGGPSSSPCSPSPLICLANLDFALLAHCGWTPGPNPCRSCRPPRHGRRRASHRNHRSPWKLPSSAFAARGASHSCATFFRLPQEAHCVLGGSWCDIPVPLTLEVPLGPGCAPVCIPSWCGPNERIRFLRAVLGMNAFLLTNGHEGW